MVKQVPVILLTIAIVLKICAGQETYQERDYNSHHYLQNPQDYEGVDSFDDFRDQTDNNREATYTRPDRDVIQSNDFLNFNRNNPFILRDNEQPQVSSSGSLGTFSRPAIDYSKNFNLNFNRGSYSLNADNSNSQRSIADVGVNNNYENTKNRVGVGVSIGGSKNFPNKSSPNSGFGFNVNGASNQQENTENSGNGILPSSAAVNGNINGAEYNNIFRAPNGKLMKLVELNPVEDVGSSIPEKSQAPQEIQNSIPQQNNYLNGGISTKKAKDFRFGGNTNINISKKFDVNGPSNFINGATGKVADVTGGLIYKAGTLANAKSEAIHGTVNGLTNVVGHFKNGVLDTTGAIASTKTNAVHGIAGKVGHIKTGLLETAGAAVDAKGNAIHGAVNSVAGKVGVMKDGLIHKAGAVASAKTNAIRGTVNAVTDKVDHITGGLLHTAGAIANAKTSAIRGAVNGVTGKVDDMNKFLLHKAGLVVDAKTGTILGIVNKKNEGVANIKGGLLDTARSIRGSQSNAVTGSINGGIGHIKSGLLQAAGTIGNAKAGAVSGTVNKSFNTIGSIKNGLSQTPGSGAGAKSGSILGSVSVDVGGVGGSGSLGLTKKGSLVSALNPLGIGRKIVQGGANKVGAVTGALGGIKSGALNVTDRLLRPGKYYGIGAIKRRVVNNILDNVQDQLQTKIGNVVGTIGQVGEGVKNHITDLSIIDNHGDKNVLRIVNGLYDTQFYLNDLPVEQAFVIFSDENQPVNFFGETLDTQQRIIEECIPTGQVYIAYKPDCVNVEEDQLSSQDFITAQNEVKNHINVIVDSLFEKYGDDIVSKAVSLTKGRL